MKFKTEITKVIPKKVYCVIELNNKYVSAIHSDINENTFKLEFAEDKSNAMRFIEEDANKIIKMLNENDVEI